MNKRPQTIDPFANDKTNKTSYPCEATEGYHPCGMDAALQIRTMDGAKHVCHTHYEMLRPKTDIDREVNKRAEEIKAKGKFPDGEYRMQYIKNLLSDFPTTA